MTCFWDGIFASLDQEDKHKLGLLTSGRRSRGSTMVQNLISALKEKNCETKGLRWQRSVLSDNDIKQNVTHIQEYDGRTAGGGYLCSTCDPFLALLSYLLGKNIHLNYCGHCILFSPATLTTPTQTYYFQCNQGHFWYVSKKRI